MWLYISISYSIAIEKLRNIDDAFRSQLENKEQKHQEEMAMLEQDKQLEVDQANQRVRIMIWHK